VIARRARLLLLPALAGFFAASPVAAKKPPARISDPVPDERLYQNAMECKVRVESILVLAGNAKDRRRYERALALWTAQEHAIGAKLGKSEGNMTGDEILFGVGEETRPGSLKRAFICVQYAAEASRQR
jgi:hypothetical protein